MSPKFGDHDHQVGRHTYKISALKYDDGTEVEKMRNDELTLERLIEEGRFHLIEDKLENIIEKPRRLQLLEGGSRRTAPRVPQALSA